MTILKGLRALDKIQKIENCVPYKLNEIIQRLAYTTSYAAKFQKKILFMDKIVIGDEKWIYFENPDHKQTTIATPKRIPLCMVGYVGHHIL